MAALSVALTYTANAYIFERSFARENIAARIVSAFTARDADICDA